MTLMNSQDARKIVEEAAAKLGEHFDSVQILVSWGVDGGGTKSCFSGTGNWYARQGMAHEFINSDIAQDAAQQIAEKLNPPDEGDAWKKT